MKYSGKAAQMLCVLALTITGITAQAAPGQPAGIFTPDDYLNFTYDVEFRPDGYLWVAGHNNKSILRFDAATGAFVDTFLQDLSLKGEIRNFAFDSKGNIYVATTSVLDRAVVWRANDSGGLEPVLSANQLGREPPIDIAFEPGTDNLYIALGNASKILKYDTSSIQTPPDLDTSAGLTTVITALPVADPNVNGMSNPRSILWAPAPVKQLYVADYLFGLLRYNIVNVNGTTEGRYDTGFPNIGLLQLDSATHLVFGPDGNLYVSVTGEDAVTRFGGPGAVDEMGSSIEGIEIDATGKYVSPRSGGLRTPYGLDFGPDGRLYVVSNSISTNEYDVLKFEGPFPDQDGDAIEDAKDLCFDTTFFAAVDAKGCSDDQVDGDGDGFCDVDAPGAGPLACTPTDNCPLDFNPDQADSNGNLVGDACEPGIEDAVSDALDIISDLLDDQNTPGKVAKKLEKAIKRLIKALDKLEKGDDDKAFREISKAVEQLLKAQKDEEVDVSDLINILVESSRMRAQDAIDAAIAAGGDQKDIDKALEQMVKAQEELIDNDPSEAIDKYKKAWEQAQKAL